MDVLTLKNIIKTNLFRSDGRINSLKISENYLKKLGIYDELIKQTEGIANSDSFSEKIYIILNDIKSRVLCQNCNEKPVEFLSFKKGYNKYCSTKCSANSKDVRKKCVETSIKRYNQPHYMKVDKFKERFKESFKKKYGVDNPLRVEKIKEKQKQTIKEKYNVDNISQLDEIKDKKVKTCLKNHNVEYSMQSESIKKKAIENSLKKYNTEYPGQSEYVLNKIKKTNLKKYGCEFYLQSERFKKQVKKIWYEKYKVDNPKKRHILNYDKLYDYDFLISNFVDDKGYFLIEECIKYFNISRSLIMNVKKELNINNQNKTNKFRLQREIYEFIIYELGIPNEKVIFNDRKLIGPYELDIYLPDYNLAIEFDGILYHSYGMSKYPQFDNHEEESPRIHLDKTEMCEERNVQLLHIFENEWVDDQKREIWKSMIRNKLNKDTEVYYVRDCYIKPISKDIEEEFLNNNHIQGYTPSKYKFGLFKDNILLSVMTFGKPRYNNSYEYELIRFCNTRNTRVIGGASKLLKYFTRNYNPKNIISYANRRWSNGNLYEKIGFTYSHKTNPNYFYVNLDDLSIHSRIQFQKHKLKDKLEYFDENLSETENMFNNNFRRIFDCGNLVYIFVNK